MNTPALPVCPKCKQTDQVQKVTSTYGLNTKEWYELSTHTDADGHTHTHREKHEAHTSLGLKLKPPQQPAGPSHPGLWYGIGIVVFLFLCSMLAPLAFIPFSLILPLMGATTFLPDIAGLPTWAVPIVVFGGAGLCGLLVIVGLLAWLGIKVKQRFERDMANYKSKKATYDNEDLPRWQRARDRWEQLYYCMRDETVFIPAENQAIRADDMEKYLYNPLYRG